jgi:hypothetical protein
MNQPKKAFENPMYALTTGLLGPVDLPEAGTSEESARFNQQNQEKVIDPHRHAN